MHYDTAHNLLVVVLGSKRVRLWPPSTAQALRAAPVYAAAGGGNHSTLDIGGGLPTAGMEAVLGPGQALFIPEGWWHQVQQPSHATPWLPPHHGCRRCADCDWLVG